MIIKQMSDDAHNKMCVYASGSVSAFEGKPPVFEAKDDKERLYLQFGIATDSMKVTDKDGNFIRWSSTYANIRMYYNADRNSAMYELAKTLKPREMIEVTGQMFAARASAPNGVEVRTPMIYIDTIKAPNRLAMLLLGSNPAEYMAIPTAEKQVELTAEKLADNTEYDFD